MKLLGIVFVVLLATTCVAIAQDQSTATQSTSTTTTKKTHKKSASSDASATESGAKSSRKTSTVTGCVSSDKGANGDYMLTNSRYKDGVDVSGSDDLSKHAGHKVQLTGSWTTPGKAFQETKIKHISETCSAAGANSASAMGDTATASNSKKSKKNKTADTTSNPKE
jgi:hypothetical protein